MNKHLVHIFTAIRDNKIVCHETNLKAFHAEFSNIEPGIGNYQRLYRRFSKNDYIEIILKDSIYFLQKLH